MQEVFDFVLAHYEAILSVITLIVSVVVLILRKKPADHLNSLIFERAIEGVKLAEKQKLSGDEKLTYAIGYVANCIHVTYPDLKTDLYYGLIRCVIEEILTTPQKKEVK